MLSDQAPQDVAQRHRLKSKACAAKHLISKTDASPGPHDHGGGRTHPGPVEDLGSDPQISPSPYCPQRSDGVSTDLEPRHV
jgi:hypothetical protein